MGRYFRYEVCQRADGTLGVKIPDTVWNAFCNRRLISDFTIGEMGKKCEKIVENVCKDLYSFEADVCFLKVPELLAYE